MKILTVSNSTPLKMRQGVDQSKRLKKLNKIAIIQMRALTMGKNGRKILTEEK